MNSKQKSLQEQHCVPCTGTVAAMGSDEASKLLRELSGWKMDDNKICKRFTFKDFVHLMDFLNRLAQVAEAEQHHPDFFASYNKLDITLYTHAAKGLTLNDFILAAKIDELRQSGI